MNAAYNEALNVLLAHVSRTLPDAMRERRAVLRAVQVFLPASHPARRNVMAQLAAMESVEGLQAELPFSFESSEQH